VVITKEVKQVLQGVYDNVSLVEPNEVWKNHTVATNYILDGNNNFSTSLK
jgi:hypothetical protein